MGGLACPGEFVPDRNYYFHTSRVNDHTGDILVTVVVVADRLPALTSGRVMSRYMFSLDVLLISSNRCENGN